MQLDTPWSRKTGDYEVYVSRLQYGNPEARIDLDEEGGLRLRRVTLDDCDRLIRAAAAARQEILAAQAEAAAPHGTAHVYHGTCQLCGKPEDDGLHAEMAGDHAQAARSLADAGLCPAFTDMEDFGATVYCDRKAGHPGSHHAPGPDEGSEVAWSDEPASVAKPPHYARGCRCEEGSQIVEPGDTFWCPLHGDMTAGVKTEPASVAS